MRERPNRDHRARLHLDGLRLERVFFELVGHEGERERGAVDRAVQVRQHVGHAADVILVRVRQHEALELALAAVEVREVRHDQVDAGQIRLGKHRTGVDDDSRVLTRDGHHVEAELAEAAKRHDIDWRHAAMGRVRGHTHTKSQPDAAS